LVIQNKIRFICLSHYVALQGGGRSREACHPSICCEVMPDATSKRHVKGLLYY
jgi:hypothetical protein